MRSRPLALLSFTFAGLAPLALIAAAPPKPPAAQSLTAFGETVEVNVVNVDVYATDKQGHRVTDLKQADFEVLEDGKPVPITNFTMPGAAAPAAAPSAAADTAVAVPRAPEDAWNLVVFVDDFNVQPAHRARVLQQLRGFLAHGLS